jgi:hypothetical protein
MTDTLAQARELLGAEALARLEHIGPVGVLVGIPSFNQSRGLAQTLIQATRGADRYVSNRKVMVLAVHAGRHPRVAVLPPLSARSGGNPAARSA